MLYRFVKILMRAALSVFYKEIWPVNLHHVPAKGPAILIANHPSSLMDAAILGILLKRPVHFFARADLFKHPIAAWILRALHMHPVQSHEGDRSTVGANTGSFNEAMQLLHGGALVLFFPEGISHTDYTLLPFKKGAFRIALNTVRAYPQLQLPIVPIGINYSHPTQLFKRVWVQAAEPILTNDYVEVLPDFSNMALHQLTTNAFKKLRESVIDVLAANNAATFQVFDTWRNATPQNISTAARITQEIDLARRVSKWSDSEIAGVIHYHQSLTDAGVTDLAIAQSAERMLSKSPLMIGLPAAIIGWLLNAAPLQLARIIADKKVRRVDFYSWILVSAAAFLYLIWLVIVSVLSFVILPAFKALALLFIIISTGQYAFNYFAYFVLWQQQQAAKKLPVAVLQVLQKKRKEILVLTGDPVLFHQPHPDQVR
jgi:glycerol-3-phosphate O-acyltransferase / dihydroxyacetone phosphate acyltransferase